MCVCVLGKQGFVGCDCLIPGGLSFHSFSHVIPQHGAVVKPPASLGSGTCLSPQSPYTPRIPTTESFSRDGDATLSAKVGCPSVLCLIQVKRGLESRHSCCIMDPVSCLECDLILLLIPIFDS